MTQSTSPWEVLKEKLTIENGPWVGFLGYEMGAFSQPDKVLPHHVAKTPDAYFQRCAFVLTVDHSSNTATVEILEHDGSNEWLKTLAQRSFWENLSEVGLKKNPHTYAVNASESNACYVRKVNEAKELIDAGEIYQVNLSREIGFSTDMHPFYLFQMLSEKNPAPFSCYMQTPYCTIVSSSPERFLKKEGSRLETRPIKGTAPRGTIKEEDERNRNMLLKSVKENAELLMITDLMRNDLGKISLPGSVKVEKLFHIEAYSNVFHLSSIVSSEVNEEQHPVDIVRSCFPGGSITGCPKLRAMEVIHDLEKRSRGIYTGSIGYFAANGDFDFNIAIRSVVFSDECASLQLGSGIVADSSAQKEYEETLYKGETVFKVLDDF